MAYKVGQVLLELKADTAKLVSGMDRAEKSIYKLKRSFADLVKAAAAIYGVTKAFQILNSVIIETSAKFEKFSLILETLEGSSKKAQEDLEWIKKFAQTTPYEIDKVTEAFVKLKSYGLNAQKELRVLGDTAAALGKPLNMAVEAIADAVTGEFERLKEFGVKAYQQGDKVAFTWADASGKARYIVVDNNREIIESTLTAIWNSKYQGAMQKLSNSWDGILSNMSDSWTNFKAETSSLAFKEAKKDLLVMQKVWNSTLNDMKQPVADFEATVVKGFKKVVLGAAIVDDSIGDLIGLIWHFGKGLLYSFDGLAYSIPAKIETLINGIIDVINSAPDFIKKAFGGDLQHLNTYSNLTQTYSKAASKEFSEAWKYVGRIARGEIGDVYKYLKQYLDKAEKEVEKSAVKVTKTTKEIGTVGQFNRDLLKNEKEIKENAKDYEDYTTRILKNRQAEVDITNKLIKQSGELVKTISDLEDDPYKRLKARYEDYLKKIQNDTVLNEKQKAELKLKVDKWYKKELQKLNKQTLEKLQNEYKKYLNENYKLFLSTLDDVNNTLETDFFDALKGKFHSFSDFLKSLFKDVGNSIYNSLAKSISGSIADYLTGSVKKAVVPSFASFVGVENFAKKLGLKLQNGQYVGEVNGQQVVLDTSGNIIQGADAVKQSFGISDVSNVKSVYDLTTKYFPQVTAALSDVSAGFQTWMSGQALITPSATATSVNAALMGSEYGQGLATSAWSKAGYYGGGALVGAGIGYGVGSLGDMLFGADTRAGTYGAIGGAIGSLIAPGIGGALLGGAIGSLLGGLFGKTKVTGHGSGIDIYGNATDSYADGQYWAYTNYKKKSWFHSKSWTDWDYTPFDEQTKEAIKHTIATFEYLYKEMYDTDTYISVKGGRFNSVEEFLSKNVVKAFLQKATSADLDYVYKLWSEYAKSINKKVYEAFNDKIGEFIKTKREWTFSSLLKKDEIEALKYKAEYLQEDFENLAKLFNITGVNAKNFAQKYEQAIKKNLTPQEIDKWEQLGEALKAATEAAEKLRAATLNQYNENSKLKEYLLQLNSTISNNIVSSVNTLIDTFEDLSNTIQTTMDNWYNGGYTPEESFEYYIQRYNEEKNTLLSYIDENGVINPNVDIKEVKKHLDFLLNLSGNLKNAASAYLSPDTRELFLNSVFNDLDYFKDVFSNTKDVLKVIITKDETDIAKNETLAGLKGAIENYNQLILKQFGDDELTLSDFFTDKSLMSPEDIRKFANILQPKNLQELDKWVNILGNVKWQGVDYIGNLTDEDKKKFFELTDKLNFENEVIKSTDALKEFNSYLTDTFKKDLDIKPLVKTFDDLATLKEMGFDVSGFVNKKWDYAKDSLITLLDYYNKFTNELGLVKKDDLGFSAFVYEVDKILLADTNKDDPMYDYYKSLVEAQEDLLANLIAKDYYLDEYNNLQIKDRDLSNITSYEDLTPYAEEELATWKEWFQDKFNIPKFANGGIVTKPTIGLIGEAGYSEAVIPLPDGHLNMRIQKDDDRLIDEIIELNNIISQMNEKIARLERVISRNEGENGLMVEMVS